MNNKPVNPIESGEMVRPAAMFTQRELFLLRTSLEFNSFHYLRACTNYGADGNVKATIHQEMTEKIVEFLMLAKFENKYFELASLIHDETQELTDYLDEKIGLPMDEHLWGNEWDEYVDRFIDEIIKMLPDLMQIYSDWFKTFEDDE